MINHLWTCYTPEWQALADVTLPYFTEYAKRHKMHLHVQTVFRQDLPFLFAKADAIAEYWWTHTPPVLWVMDIDLIFTNMKLKLPTPKKCITLSRDINGMNCGVFALSGPAPIPYLYMKSVAALAPHFKDLMNPDQTTMGYLAPAYDQFTEYVAQPCFNSIPLNEYPEYNEREYTEEEGQWKPGHLVCHLPGRTIEERLSIFPKYQQEVIR